MIADWAEVVRGAIVMAILALTYPALYLFWSLVAWLSEDPAETRVAWWRHP